MVFRYVARSIPLMLMMLVASRAMAQVPEKPGDEETVVRWQTTATISIMLQNGVTDQRQIAMSGESFRQIPEGHPDAWKYAIQGDYTYASVKIGDAFTAVADSQRLSFTAEREMTEHLFFVVRPAFKRNEIQGVEYRLEGLGGLGVEVHEGKFAEVDVIGVAGGVRQEKGVPEADGSSFVVGTVQTSQWALAQGWGLRQMLLYLQPLDDSDDYRLQLQTALTGAITRHLAVSIGYDFDRENLVIGASRRADRRLSVGVQLTF